MGRRTWIKICGITRAEDAQVAVESGVDALGFVFAESPRKIAAAEARSIARSLPPHILRFGVFVDETPSEIERIVTESEVDRVQLHVLEADESDQAFGRDFPGIQIVRAFRARDASVLESIRAQGSSFFLLDSWSEEAAGGTGRVFDWSIARSAARLGRLVLAGGLNPGNVMNAIQAVGPFGVDVSSGVERHPGEKDPALLRAFVQAVRRADFELRAPASRG